MGIVRKEEVVCYKCGEVGHKKLECPKKFDICHMTMEECQEWIQKKDLPENWKTGKDFPEGSE